MKNEEAKIRDLELQWQDHHHARNQTWRALQITGLLAIALVGVGWTEESIAISLIVAVLLIFVSIFGMQITIRHRNKVERTKFKSIIKLEKDLGLFYGYKVPSKIKWWHVFCLLKSNTSLFILRMQFIILIFGIVIGMMNLFQLLST